MFRLADRRPADGQCVELWLYGTDQRSFPARYTDAHGHVGALWEVESDTGYWFPHATLPDDLWQPVEDDE